MDLKSKIILIYGPTASGKSEFAIQLANKINGEIINLASGKNIKLSKIFEVIKKEIKSDIKPTWNSMKNREWDQEYWVADIQKFKKLYNNKKLISLDTGIMKFYSWYKKNKKYYNAKL